MTSLKLSEIEARINSFVQNLGSQELAAWAKDVLPKEQQNKNPEDTLDRLALNASMQISRDPIFSALASNLLLLKIETACVKQDILKFSDSIERGFKLGLIAESTKDFVEKNKHKLNAALQLSSDSLLEFFSLKTLSDRYFLLDPQTRLAIETPQYFFMRVACGLSQSEEECVALYRMISSLEYLPSTPTLFNSATPHSQMSSCYLLDSPEDTLESIYQKYTDVALLSKHAGGVGLAFHRVRARGSLIKGTNGHSNGIVPWLKTLDASVAAVNQGGKRKGACCVYLETWHADIEEFLELKDSTGDEARRTHNLNLAHWIPDLFMKRVETDALWSLFDPKDTPDLPDLFGDAFEEAYQLYEKNKIYRKQIPARDLYARMMRTLAQTGNGWMNFKDSANKKCSQTLDPKNVVHLSNLCTEIIEVSDSEHTAVCNLGSINLSKHLTNDGNFDFKKLRSTVFKAVQFLDRVIDINFYPIESAKKSNSLWRPIGLGVMGLQDLFFLKRLPFDCDEAKLLSKKIAEHIYFYALEASCELSQKFGKHPNFDKSRYSKGVLQFDIWQRESDPSLKWKELREKIQSSGLRNSLLVAIAPTATIASIAGCYESIEPQVSVMFKRETLSGEFIQNNKYLVADLKKLGLWNAAIRNQIKQSGGSIQNILEIPENLRLLYRNAWELPMKALIDMASDRGAFIDQSQSLNLFMETPTIEKMSSMYFYAWKAGLKTTYYLRSRPASEISTTACEVCQ